MKITVITPAFNSARFVERTIRSVRAQRAAGADLEYFFIDGGSTDGTLDIARRYEKDLDLLVSEPDGGPADAINKGLARASGELVAWLNADDVYAPGALSRAAETAARHPRAALVFGRCRIVDESGAEIRRAITRFKELFFPFSCRPLIQSINYVSQPAAFFRRSAVRTIGGLNTGIRSAWDYDFILRLWRRGGGARIPGPPVADFRWHPSSLSGRTFRDQFREEFEIARADAGRFAPQTLAHAGVRWGIVTIYAAMERARRPVPAKGS